MDEDHCDRLCANQEHISIARQGRMGLGFVSLQTRWCSRKRGATGPVYYSVFQLEHRIQTPQGTIMLTSLEKFRSDYTTVPIPSGNFLDVREGLYANINLLRMGCSGRSALTLEEPRFASSFVEVSFSLLITRSLFYFSVTPRRTASLLLSASRRIAGRAIYSATPFSK